MTRYIEVVSKQEHGPERRTLWDFPTVENEIRDASLRKIYFAQISQTSTDAPTATVFENTIGAIVWTRLNVGAYIGTLAGAFPLGKVFLQATPGSCAASVVQASRDSDNTVAITIADDTGNNIDLSGSLSLSIYVYP